MNNETTMIEFLSGQHQRMLRELQSDMADLVAAGEMTDIEANEWVQCRRRSLGSRILKGNANG